MSSSRASGVCGYRAESARTVDRISDVRSAELQFRVSGKLWHPGLQTPGVFL